MKIAIYGRQFNDQAVFPYIRQIFDNITKHRADIYIHHQFNEYLSSYIDTSRYKILGENDHVKDFIDLFLTLGGDGTLLDTIAVIRDSGIPVIGINFGRLGFLASVNKSDIAAAIHAVVNKQFTLDKRGLLTIESEQKIFGDHNFALNDVTIHKRDDSAMITTHMYLD